MPMRMRAKFWGVSVGAGTVLGLSAVAFMYSHRLDTNIDAVRAGFTALGVVPSTTVSPKITPSPGGSGQALGVSTDNSTTADNLANNSTNLSTGSNLATPTPASTASTLPDPSGFSVYDKYKTNAYALFIDTLPGTGTAVAAGSNVTVNYKGWLTNGTEFDESYARGKAFSFTEGAHNVIAGWEEGLYGMKAGGKRRLIIPPSLGYGAAGQGSIPANSVLVFDVELVSVQ